MLSYLVSSSTWAQSNRDELWEHVRDVFVQMPPWAAGKGRLCLAMCFFGHEDSDHGRKMRSVLASLQDSEEKVKLTMYVCEKVSTDMAVAICGYWVRAQQEPELWRAN